MKTQNIVRKQLPILFIQPVVNGEKNTIKISPSILLDKWNTLINGNLYSENDGNAINEEKLEALINESECDHQLIRSILIEDIIEKANLIDKEQYVKINQTLLIHILDELFLLSQNKHLTKNISILFRNISEHMQSTLDFIEEFFGNYFDRSEKIPEPYLSIGKGRIKKQLTQLNHSFSRKDDIDPVLVAVISTAIEHSLRDDQERISYLQLSYHKSLLLELLSKKTDFSTKSIKQTLYYYNYNEANFINYEYNYLNKITFDIPINKEKIEALRFEQKMINQLPFKFNVGYNQDMPSLRDQVNGWINEEIKYIENTSFIKKEEERGIENENKIHTSLSVAKLALIIRLLVIDKIIINRTIAPMIRIVSRIFTTLQRDEISFGSLETKYHAPDKATITAVRDMLFKWINILGKL